MAVHDGVHSVASSGRGCRGSIAGADFGRYGSRLVVADIGRIGCCCCCLGSGQVERTRLIVLLGFVHMGCLTRNGLVAVREVESSSLVLTCLRVAWSSCSFSIFADVALGLIWLLSLFDA